MLLRAAQELRSELSTGFLPKSNGNGIHKWYET
jgi:hypothetical protein